MGSKPVFAVGGAWCPTEFTYSATEIHGRKLPCKAAQCMLVGKTVLPCASLAHNSFPASAVPSLIEIWPCTSTCQENREHLHVTDLPDSFDWEQKGADLWCCLNTHTEFRKSMTSVTSVIITKLWNMQTFLMHPYYSVKTRGSVHRMNGWIGLFFSSRRSCGTSEKSEGSWLMLGSLHRRSSWRLASLIRMCGEQLMELHESVAYWLGCFLMTCHVRAGREDNRKIGSDVSWAACWVRCVLTYPLADAFQVSYDQFLPNSGKFRQQLCWWKRLFWPQWWQQHGVVARCGGGLSKQGADCGMFGGWPYLAFQFLQKAGGMFSEADWPYYKEGMFPCMPKGQGCFKWRLFWQLDMGGSATLGFEVVFFLSKCQWQHWTSVALEVTTRASVAIMMISTAVPTPQKAHKLDTFPFLSSCVTLAKSRVRPRTPRSLSCNQRLCNACHGMAIFIQPLDARFKVYWVSNPPWLLDFKVMKLNWQLSWCNMGHCPFWFWQMACNSTILVYGQAGRVSLILYWVRSTDRTTLKSYTIRDGKKPYQLNR